MIAVIETGGKQYLVKAGQILKVEKLEGKKGDNISLSNVLAVSDSANFTFGKPLIKNASVESVILIETFSQELQLIPSEVLTL